MLLKVNRQYLRPPRIKKHQMSLALEKWSVRGHRRDTRRIYSWVWTQGASNALSSKVQQISNRRLWCLRSTRSMYHRITYQGFRPLQTTDRGAVLLWTKCQRAGETRRQRTAHLNELKTITTTATTYNSRCWAGNRMQQPWLVTWWTHQWTVKTTWDRGSRSMRSWIHRRETTTSTQVVTLWIINSNKTSIINKRTTIIPNVKINSSVFEIRISSLTISIRAKLRSNGKDSLR